MAFFFAGEVIFHSVVWTLGGVLASVREQRVYHFCLSKQHIFPLSDLESWVIGTPYSTSMAVESQRQTRSLKHWFRRQA